MKPAIATFLDIGAFNYASIAMEYILMNDLVKKYVGLWCAENVKILVRSKFFSTLSVKSQMDLKIYENWCKEEKLSKSKPNENDGWFINYKITTTTCKQTIL